MPLAIAEEELVAGALGAGLIDGTALAQVDIEGAVTVEIDEGSARRHDLGHQVAAVRAGDVEVVPKARVVRDLREPRGGGRGCSSRHPGPSPCARSLGRCASCRLRVATAGGQKKESPNEGGALRCVTS